MIVALLHDVLITVGIYSLTGREVTASTVAAMLTVLGYSIYDTIIIFDRVRENIPLMRRASFADIANVSLWETIRRSLATTFITLLPVGALLLFGGATLKDFAFALLIGIAIGAVLVDLHRGAAALALEGARARVRAGGRPATTDGPTGTLLDVGRARGRRRRRSPRPRPLARSRRRRRGRRRRRSAGEARTAQAAAQHEAAWPRPLAATCASRAERLVLAAFGALALGARPGRADRRRPRRARRRPPRRGALGSSTSSPAAGAATPSGSARRRGVSLPAFSASSAW